MPVPTACVTRAAAGRDSRRGRCEKGFSHQREWRKAQKKNGPLKRTLRAVNARTTDCFAGQRMSLWWHHIRNREDMATHDSRSAREVPCLLPFEGIHDPTGVAMPRGGTADTAVARDRDAAKKRVGPRTVADPPGYRHGWELPIRSSPVIAVTLIGHFVTVARPKRAVTFLFASITIMQLSAVPQAVASPSQPRKT